MNIMNFTADLTGPIIEAMVFWGRMPKPMQASRSASGAGLSTEMTYGT